MFIPSFQSQEYEHARLWIATITGSPDTPVWWRAIHDLYKTQATAPVGMQLSISVRGTLREYWRRLWRWNDDGYGIFMQVNESNGHGCEAKNIIRVRANHIDIDAHHGTNIPGVEAVLPPSMRVTGRAPGHLYWVVTDCPVSEFKATQNGLIKALGSDNSINNLDRIMRVPPFFNRKFKGRHPVSIVYANDLRYTLAEIHAVFPPVVARYSATRKASTGGGCINATSVEDLESYSMESRCAQGRSYLAEHAPAKALDGKHHHEDRKTVAIALFVRYGIDEDLVIDMMNEWSPQVDKPGEHEEIIDWILTKTWTDRGSSLRPGSAELAADLDVDVDVDVDVATPAAVLGESVAVPVPEAVPDAETDAEHLARHERERIEFLAKGGPCCDGASCGTTLCLRTTFLAADDDHGDAADVKDCQCNGGNPFAVQASGCVCTSCRWERAAGINSQPSDEAFLYLIYGPANLVWNETIGVHVPVSMMEETMAHRARAEKPVQS